MAGVADLVNAYKVYSKSKYPGITQEKVWHWVISRFLVLHKKIKCDIEQPENNSK